MSMFEEGFHRCAVNERDWYVIGEKSIMHAPHLDVGAGGQSHGGVVTTSVLVPPFVLVSRTQRHGALYVAGGRPSETVSHHQHRRL